MFATTALAAPMMSGEMELAWDSQIYAPAHLQAEIVTTPVEGFAFLPFTSCAAYAVVKIAFKGGDVFPAGRRFRLQFPWGNGWYLSNHDKLQPPSAGDVVCTLSRGTKVEVFIDRSGSTIGSGRGFGLFKILAFTNYPMIEPEKRPSWYQKDADLLTRLPQDWQKNVAHGPLGDPLPLAFPSNDVTITYRSSYDPSSVYTAYFNASMQRIVVKRPGSFFSAPEHSILDPVVSAETILDDRHRTYVLIPYTDVLTDRFKWPDLHPKAVGSEVIAGLPCTDFELQAGTYLPPVRPATICVTKDGVRLKRTQEGVTQTAISVVYGEVPPDYSLVPGRVPGSGVGAVDK